jgi:cell division protein ZapA (FtsZ GTPase activity inhibitor)
VQVEIAGLSLAIKSDESEGYVAALAQHVDAIVGEMTAGRRGRVDLQRVALLAALRPADQLYRERDLARRFREGVQARLSALEAALAEHERRLEQL